MKSPTRCPEAIQEPLNRLLEKPAPTAPPPTSPDHDWPQPDVPRGAVVSRRGFTSVLWGLAVLVGLGIGLLWARRSWWGLESLELFFVSCCCEQVLVSLAITRTVWGYDIARRPPLGDWGVFGLLVLNLLLVLATFAFLSSLCLWAPCGTPS